jgi:hypothetical protein
VIEPSTVTLRDASARLGEAVFRVSGTVDAPTGTADVAINARTIVLDQKLIASLPAGIKRMLEKSELTASSRSTCRACASRPPAARTPTAGRPGRT